MARLIGPDSGDRLTVRPGGNGYARSAQVIVYAAATGSTLADILTEAGAAVSGSTLTTDDFGLIPLFQFPDGVDTVYVEVAGGPRTAVYARYDDRVDALAARVTAVEGVGLNANLTTIGALSSATAGALVTDGSGWIRKTYAQLKTALGLVKADVGLGNVDNTADTAKPISTAQQSALDLKLSIAAASGAYTPDIIGSLRYPLYISHRGGNLRFPEASAEAYEQSYRDGFPLELDLQPLADGTIVCVHDASSPTTMSGITGSIQSATVAQWNAAQILQTVNTALINGRKSQPLYWEQVLDRWGGRILLLPEIKYDNAAFAANVYASITRRVLQKSIIVTSFYYARLLEAVAAGLHVLLYTSDETRSAASLVADGIEYVGADMAAVSQSYINGLRAAGIKVFGWTVNEKSTADGYLAAGLDGIISDSAWRVSRRYAPAVATDFGSGYLAPLTTRLSQTTDQVVIDALKKKIVFTNTGADQGAFIRLGDFGDKSSVCTVRFTLQFKGGATSDTRHCDVWVGHLETDNPYKDQAVADALSVGHMFMTRRNGGLETYQRNNAASTTQVASASSTSLVPTLTLSSGLSSGVAITALPVSALPVAVPVGATFSLPGTTGPQRATVTVAAAAGATSLTVASITPNAAVASGASIANGLDGTVCEYEVTITSTTLTLKNLTTGASVGPTTNTVAGRPTDAAISIGCVGTSAEVTEVRVSR